MEGEEDYMGHKENFRGQEQIHDLFMKMVSQVYTYVKSYEMIHLKYVKFIALLIITY